MLPRYKLLEDFLAKATQRFIYQHSNRDGLLGELRSHIIHEGKGTAIRRPDDSVDDTQMISAEAEISVNRGEIENLNLAMVLEKLKSMADQFQAQRTKHVFETLDEVTKKTGQVHNAQGKPLTHEDFFAMIDKMHVNFEKNQTMGDFSIVASPQIISVFARLDREIHESPELRKRLMDLMEKKKNEYREREINRNLAG